MGLPGHVGGPARLAKCWPAGGVAFDWRVQEDKKAGRAPWKRMGALRGQEGGGLVQMVSKRRKEGKVDRETCVVKSKKNKRAASMLSHVSVKSKGKLGSGKGKQI